MKQTTLANRLLLLIIVSCSCIIVSCGSSNKKDQSTSNIPYPNPQPDSTAISFFPRLVSTDSTEFGSAFSPDGSEFYFSRTANGISKIYYLKFDGNTWGIARSLFPADDDSSFADADPAFAPDGTLYFISNRPTSESDTLPDYNIWYLEPLPPSEVDVSIPQNFTAINSDSNEYYISFAQNGNLYFSSSRNGGFGQEDIYVSKLENGKYTAPENLGPNINTDKSEYDPGIAPDEKMLLFASSKRNDSYGMADLYCAIPNEKMLWTQTIHLDTTINSATRDYCPYFTPDGKYFFFTSNKDVKWVTMEGLRKSVTYPGNKK